MPTILVGHVTKDGTLAGPKTLEHIVDVVLTLEGERFSGLRLLRSSKNRFGSTEEVGVFEMAADGLREVADPGAAFIETESLGAPGVAVAATLEGSRPLLVEVQALVAPAGPRIAATHRFRPRLAATGVAHRGARPSCGHEPCQPRRLREHRRRPRRRRAGDRPAAGAGAGLRAARQAAGPGNGPVRRDRPDRRAATGQRPRAPAARGRAPGVHAGDRPAPTGSWRATRTMSSASRSFASRLCATRSPRRSVDQRDAARRTP